MKVTAFNNNLFQLTRLGFVNCYLVREEDGFTLIDTGMSGQAQLILPMGVSPTTTHSSPKSRTRCPAL